MSDLFEDPEPRDEPRRNEPEFSVSELSGAVKRSIEGGFSHVRVRGEVGRVVVARTGHVYFDLKDDKATLASICWKGTASRLTVMPEEGMEVVATGRLTTFAQQSKYQMVVEDVAPAGVGALMAMLEKRRAQLQAEGLFDPARKKQIPFLPEVIGVVTSLQGAVIRDILHRLRDRFPRRVLIWPVAVQGKDCAPQVAAAIRGFNALSAGGPIPRPDLLIVARGGGSIEDLWGFNEEEVVRAAAASRIPLISAVGHETDTTLIDFASDRRAPTPTAAAEMAVPVRLDLLAAVEGQGARLLRAAGQGVALRGQRLRDLARALPRPEALLAGPSQRLDLWSHRLPAALRALAARRRAGFERAGVRLQPALLSRFLIHERRMAEDRAARLPGLLGQGLTRRRENLGRLSLALEAGFRRSLADNARATARGRERLAVLSTRLDTGVAQRLEGVKIRLEALERLRQTLGYRETLRRGYVVVRAEGQVVTSRMAAEPAPALELEFHDGTLIVGPALPASPKRRKKAPPAAGGPEGEDGQGTLL